MIFEEVVLHNFGPYRGRHEVCLTPTQSRPVVLIGALNGSGKTSLLDAMQLSLYGKMARCTGRDRIGYLDYLGSMINRDVSPSLGAGVELSFVSRVDGRDCRMRVVRTWQRRGESIRENFEVFQDGQLDTVVSERWAEFVEDFMPSQIADLFFFDGEKIEALADPQRSAALLRTGIHSLLGIDLIDSLSSSLTVVERKKKVSAVSTSDRAVLDSIEEKKAEAFSRCEQLRQKLAGIANEEDRAKVAEASARDEFRRQGGELLGKRDQLTADQERLVEQKSVIENELRELAAGVLPLAIPKKTLARAMQLADKARLERDAGIMASSTELRDEQTVAFVKSVGIAGETVTKLVEFLRQDRETRYSFDPTPSAVPVGILMEYRADDIKKAVVTTRRSLVRLEEVSERLHDVERNLSAVPSEEGLSLVQSDLQERVLERQRVALKKSLLEQELAELESSLARLDQQAEKEAHRLGAALIKDDVARRVSSQSARARETLARFKERLLRENLGRLEGTILKSFQELIRKRQLVDGISIDPATYQISVVHPGGQIVPAHNLSAGERQLLSVATLWALGKASERHLPVVIDTPLSRLDSKHRGTLVGGYFPKASHQVILLSTDEEFVGDYYRRLKPFIGREYLIDHDEDGRTSRFVEGYFQSQSLLEAA